MTTGFLFATTTKIDDILRDAGEDMVSEDVLRETQEVFNEMECNSATHE